MLLKYSQSEKRSKINGNSRQQRSTGNMKLLAGSTVLNPRLPRKTVKGFAAKRPSSHLRPLPASGREEHRTPIDASDNSNDSGLGFDQHLDVTATVHAVLRLSDREPVWDNGHSEAKRKKLDIKLESDDANDNFSFSHAMSKSQKANSQPGGLECLMPSRGGAGASGMQRPLGGATGNGSAGVGGGAGGVQRGSLGRLPHHSISVSARRPPGPVSLSSPLIGHSRDGRVQLQIASQPEQQHRARYQTEGSRGAVKDRSGNGFPVVKLIGYNKPATLQVFIGTDMGRVAPHMFYQACKVSGKNSTPCVEKKIDGTIVIEVDFDPAKDMTITCDCVGILKERNVDVEHRFPDQSGARNKKKSTRCRMVFRTTITNPEGSSEILQTSSQPIVCTQPPGVPEICKKSLSAAACTGGMELFILGKNFLKDTRVVFQQNEMEPSWEETVQPDKEFLQQTHLVCIVPAYQRYDIIEPVTVRLLVTSSGKTSEPHSFTYMPAPNPVLQPAVGTSDIPQTCLNLVSSGVSHGCVDLNRVFNKPPLGPPSGLILPGTPTKPPATMMPGLPNQFLPVDPPPARVKKDVHPIRLWPSMSLVGDPAKAENVKARDNESKSHGLKMMPPPPPLLPIARGSSSNVLIIPDMEPDLKTEILDESSQESVQSVLSPEDLKGIDLRMKPPASAGPIATVSDLLSTQSPSLATFRRFVSNPSDAPLPTQSGQSVEKYLSHIENPIAPKAGNSSGGGAGGGSNNSGGGGSNASAAATAVAVTVVPSAAPTANPSDSAAQEIVMNKMCNADTNINSQFNNPIMFGPSQASNSGLLAPSLPSTVSETQKISFGNDITLPTIYGSASSVVEKEQKPQLVEQASLQDTMASRLLAVGLNTVVPASQTKSKYQENPLPSLCPSQSLPSTLLPTITNATLPDFSASGPSSTEPSSLNCPNLLSTIANSSTIMETGSSLIFNNTQQQDHKSLITSAEVSQKTDEQLIDSNKISNHSLSSSSSTAVGVMGSSHNMLPSSVTSTDNTTLNISAQPNTITGKLLAATQAESAIMSGTSDTRLNALVSSAIESRILEANCQNQTAEKLDVFSSTQNIIRAVTTDNAVLSAQAQVPLNDSLGTNQNTPSPPIQEMTLNSTLTVPSVNTFPLSTLSSTQTAAQITQENIILNNTLTSAFSTHLLNTDSSAKTADITLNPVSESSLALEPVASTEASPIVLSNPACAPPIAMKSIIMSSTNSSVDNNLMNSGTTQSPQISGKNIVNSSTIGSSNIPHISHTSPVAVKTMMLAAAADKATVMTTAMDVKDILAPPSVKEDIALAAGTALCTSPIAMKKIILETASVVSNVLPDQALGVKSILNSQPSDNVLASAVPLSSDKLDALVESTMSKHVLTSPVQTTTSGMSIDGAVCSSTNSLPLTTQSLATILGSNMSSNLPNGTSLPGTNSVLLPETETRELHNSTGVTPIENSNVALTSPQTLQSGSPGILSSQSPSVSGTSLITMFSSESESSTKSQTLEPVPSVATTCSSLLNHHLGIFGPQPNVTVHTLLSPNQSSTDAQTLSHTIPFTSTNSNTSGLISTTPCTLSKLEEVPSTTVQEGQAQARLLNEAFMVLANDDNRKNQIDVIVTQENKVNKEVESPKYVVTSVECKIAEGGSVQSCSSAVTKLDVQAVHMQQQQQKIQMAQQQNMPDQEKQGEKTHIVSNAPLSVPVTDISSVRQTAKDSVVVVAAPAQKKMEEGMVPQELTQMSESDLLSYINPSCFDQV